MNEKPRRRWLRFRLRTLLIVVTVAGCWLGWNVNIVRQRAALRKLMWDRGVGFSAWAKDGSRVYLTQTPLVRRTMGDFSIGMIWNLDHLTENEMTEVRAAFPEAELL